MAAQHKCGDKIILPRTFDDVVVGVRTPRRSQHICKWRQPRVWTLKSLRHIWPKRPQLIRISEYTWRNFIHRSVSNYVGLVWFIAHRSHTLCGLGWTFVV